MRFLLAALAVLLLILAARGLSRISGPYLARQRPVTDLLIGANLRAFVVAFAAGSAGIIALGRAKSGAVVGVLVSIITIPAAFNVGVALAMGNPSEADRGETRDLSAKGVARDRTPLDRSGRRASGTARALMYRVQARR